MSFEQSLGLVAFGDVQAGIVVVKHALPGQQVGFLPFAEDQAGHVDQLIQSLQTATLQAPSVADGQSVASPRRWQSLPLKPLAEACSCVSRRSAAFSPEMF